MKHFFSPDRGVRAISNLLSEKYPCRKIAQTFILFEMQSSVRYVHAHHLKLDDMIVLGLETLKFNSQISGRLKHLSDQTRLIELTTCSWLIVLS